MIKKELVSNFKNFLVWILVLVIMFLFVYLIYPFIITDENMEAMNEMMNAFPPEVLKAFNMDMASIDSAYGWFKTEGFMFILLIIGIYSSILGGSIVLKEESDKTIEYLGFLPIKRKMILTNKIIVSIIYILSMVVIFGLFNFIALVISGDFDKKEFLLLSITPIFVALPLFGLNLLISMFMHKTKKVVGISLGMVFIFYLFSVISEMSSNVEFMKYFSIYTFADTRNIMAEGKMNIWIILISLALSSLLVFLSYLKYDKKELI